MLDTLSTHKPASRHRQEARVPLPPRHGSWLNIAEIELAVLSGMCLSRRMPDEDTPRRQVEANVRERNAKAVPVKWRFTTQNARRKLARMHPRVST
ncbi:MAG: hypothetical protein Q8O25_16375 [Sulfurisoma sp.]|nr:hypothetical protein [Sulfurisoma sp.]